MQLYNSTNTTKSISIAEWMCNVFTDAGHNFSDKISKVLDIAHTIKEKVISVAKTAFIAVAFFAVITGSVLLNGISVINGKVFFEPNLVILPAFELILGLLGFNVMISLITDAFNSK